MDNQLYLIEILVEEINFNEKLKELPARHQLCILTTIGNFLVLDVHADTLLETKSEDDPDPKRMRFNSGRSCLFPFNPTDFEETLITYPLNVNVCTRETFAPMGVVKESWPPNFLEIIRQSSEQGYTTPATLKTTFDIRNDGGETIGTLIMGVRLSSMGNQIQTHFQLIDSEDVRQQCLIRAANTTTTFQCKKFKGGEPEEFLPIGPLYNANALSSLMNATSHDAPRVSWLELWNTSINTSRLSTAPAEFRNVVHNFIDQYIDQYPTMDIVSIVERPNENKFFDLTITPGSGGFLVSPPLDQDREEDQKSAEIGNHSFEPDDTPDVLDAETINRLVCKSADCPGAQKFKEYGLGPLAKNKCLGTLYTDVDAPCVYSLSHTYGTLDNYGPYGLFRRPKRPDLPFIPKKNPFDDPLRLKGGGSVDAECCDDGKIRPKSPIHECQDVMQELDRIVREYHEALGPCGGVTCKYTPNLASYNCEKNCRMNTVETPRLEDDIKSCGSVQCPLSGQMKTCEDGLPKKFPHSACGYPSCAYTKYKIGLTDEDALLELQMLPPAISGGCGKSDCPFPVKVDLPPIHWDCPDPLPKGRCKNKNCPYLPADLKAMEKLKPKGPCGSPTCPYALPQPCKLETCPFKPSDIECDNPDCSSNTQEDSLNSICKNPNCPYATDILCSNPTCPFKKPPEIKHKPQCTFGKKDNIEHHPICPFSKRDNIEHNSLCPLAKLKCDICKSPKCPFLDENQSKICDNPKCPYAKPKDDVCQNPTCPFAAPKEKGDNNCSNPKCPFAKPKDQPKNIICSNPECPFATDKDDACPASDEDVCNNPNCPFKKDDKSLTESTCQNPKCPFKQDFQSITGDTCGNPKCPSALKQEKKNSCKNPDCPFKENKESLIESVCSNPECLFAPPLLPETACKNLKCPKRKNNKRKRSTITDKPEGSEDSLCGNPDCPYVKYYGKKDEVCTSTCGQSQNTSGSMQMSTLDENCQVFSKLFDLINQWCRTNDLRLDVQPKAGADGQCIRVCIDSAPKNALSETEEEEYPMENTNDTAFTTCTDLTCTAECGECMEKGEIEAEANKGAVIQTKRGRKRSRSKYVYSVGDKYPGVHVGHKVCNMPCFRVPPRMGWLWNIHTPCMTLRPRRGWRPGAMTKTIAERLRLHRKQQGLPLLSLPEFGPTGKRRRRAPGAYESHSSVNIEPKPTLHITKKEGCYWITMNPLKDPKTLAPNENPYMDCTPLQFKIQKNKNKMKVKGGDGYRTCFCNGDEVVEEEEDSSSDSELDIEFTPPAGLIHPERFKKTKNVVHCNTQYDPKDFKQDTDAKSSKSSKKGKKGKKKGKK